MPSVAAKLRYSFNAEAIAAGVDKAEARVMAQSAAYVMRVARNSLKRASKKSPSSGPGETPRGHDNRIKTFLSFGFDSSTGRTLVGPEKLPNAVSDTELSALEHGGETEIQESAGQFVTNASGKTERLQQDRKRKVTMAARPFMQPALVRSAGKLKQIWAGSIKRGRA